MGEAKNIPNWTHTLSEKLSKKDFKCPVCYNENFKVIPDVVTVPSSKASLGLGGPPLSYIICEICGHVMFFYLPIAVGPDWSV